MSEKLNTFRTAVEKVATSNTAKPALQAALAWAGYEENARQHYDQITAELVKRVEALEGTSPPDPDPDPPPDHPPPLDNRPVLTHGLTPKSGDVIKDVIIRPTDKQQTGIFIGSGIHNVTISNVLIENVRLGVNMHPSHLGGHILTGVFVRNTGDTGFMDQARVASEYNGCLAEFCGRDEAGRITTGDWGVDPSLGVHGYYIKSQSTFNNCGAHACKKNGFSIRTHNMKLNNCWGEDVPILVAWFDDNNSLGPEPHLPVRIDGFIGKVRAGQMVLYIDGAASTPQFELTNFLNTALGAGCRGMQSYRPVTKHIGNRFMTEGNGSWAYTEDYK